jgi:O-antigen ligase
MALLTAVWTGAGVLLLLVAPMAAPAVLGLAVAAPLAWCRLAHGRWLWRPVSAVEGALALAAVYFLINASWSLSRAEAYAAVAMLFAAIAVLHLTTASLPHVPTPALRAMGIGLLAGLGIGAAFLCFELASDQWLHRALATAFADFRPRPRHMRMEAGRVTSLNPYLLNQCVAALTLMFWPALLALGQLALGLWQRRLLLVGLCLTPVAILLSEHGTSKAAFAGAAAIYGIGRLSALSARRLLAAGWVVATLLAVPIAHLVHVGDLHTVRALEYSIRHRIVIWNHTAGEIAKAPVLGVGIDTPRALNRRGIERVPQEPGTDFPLLTPLHSHDAYLQVWHETGAVGAAFLLVLGLLVLRAIAAQPKPLQHRLYAMFAACAAVAASSFSLWAPWFMSTLALVPIFAGIGLGLYRNGGSEPS